MASNTAKMAYRRIDSTGEPVFGQGRQDFLTDVDAVGQAIVTRLHLYLGEWWEDLNEGIPMWQSMLGVPGSKKEGIDRIIQNEILTTENVKEITEIQSRFDPATRTYQFYAKVDTIFGEVQIQNQGAITR